MNDMTNLTGNTRLNNRAQRGTITKLFALLIISFGLTLIVGVQQASAHATLSPQPGAIPGTIKGMLESCDHGPKSPAFGNWISPQGSPQQTSVNVDYGTGSVSLDLHINGAVCKTERPYATEMRSKIISVKVTPPPNALQNPGTVSGLQNSIRILSGFTNVPGRYADTGANGFTYTPFGGFTVNGTYYVTITIKSINRFSNTGMTCVGGKLQTEPPTSNWNFNPCNDADVTVPIDVNVRPPSPKIQGRVYNLNTRQGIPNVSVNVCNGIPVVTNAQGYYEKEVANTSQYCAAVNSTVPNLNGPFIRPYGTQQPYEGYPNQSPPCPAFTSDQNPNYCSQTGYSGQIAGLLSGATATDRSTDSGFDFVYTELPTTCLLYTSPSPRDS